MTTGGGWTATIRFGRGDKKNLRSIVFTVMMKLSAYKGKHYPIIVICSNLLFLSCQSDMIRDRKS